MKKYFLLIITSLLILTNITFAEKSNEIKELENKISNLEYKLELMDKSNSDYLEIVKRFIQTLGALFGGIIFLNWFNNYKAGVKEIENIESRIKNENKVYLNNIKNSLINSIDDETKREINYLEIKFIEFKILFYKKEKNSIYWVSEIQSYFEKIIHIKHNKFPIERGLNYLKKYLEEHNDKKVYGNYLLEIDKILDKVEIPELNKDIKSIQKKLEKFDN